MSERSTAPIRVTPRLVLIVANALIVLSVGAYFLWPDSSTDPPAGPAVADSSGNDGVGVIGTVSAGSTSRSSPATGAASSAVPDPSAVPPPPPDAQQGALLVRTEIRRPGLLSYTVRVLITNTGEKSGTWHSIGLRLSGLNLAVTPSDATMSHEYRAPVDCLVAAAPVSLAAGASVLVEATVTGALGRVDSARLDEAPCPT